MAGVWGRRAGGRTEGIGRIGLAIVVAVFALSVLSAPQPTPVSAGGGAAACTVGDTFTRYLATSDWYRSVLDTQLRLRRGYTPPDLVRVSRSGASGYGYIRRIALADLRAMYRAARTAGAAFAIESPYRSYATQIWTFNWWVHRVGYTRALLASARAGHSEHQLGTTIDVKTPGGGAPWYSRGWGQTRIATWMARNSWRYGWILSYPEVRSPKWTCYKWEPWHFRWFGRPIAARIHASGLTAREWLWAQGGTGTWTGGAPFPTPTPAPTPSPTPSPTPTPDPTPTPTPA